MTPEQKSIWVRNGLFVLSFIFVAFIFYLRWQYDKETELSKTYQKERDLYIKKNDSLVLVYNKLETELTYVKVESEKRKITYDSLKTEFYKKIHEAPVTNKPILHYNVVQLDKFWSDRYR